MMKLSTAMAIVSVSLLSSVSMAAPTSGTVTVRSGRLIAPRPTTRPVVAAPRPHVRPGHGPGAWAFKLNQLEQTLNSGTPQAKVYALKELELYPVPKALYLAVKSQGAFAYQVKVAANQAANSLMKSVDIRMYQDQIKSFFLPLLSQQLAAEVKVDALKILQMTKSPDVIIPIVKMAGAFLYQVKQQAKIELQQLINQGIPHMISPAMVEELAQIIEGRFGAEEKVAAIKVIGAAKKPRSKMILINALNDFNYQVKQAAKFELKKY